MKIIELNKDKIAYVVSNKILVCDEQGILDLMAELGPRDIIIHDYNLDKKCFDLSTKKLGDILQKLTNYQVRLAIIGDFSKYKSQVLPDFINESNQHGQYLFVDSLDKVKKIWRIA